MASVRVNDKSPLFFMRNREQMGVAVGRMAQDVMILAKVRVPYKSGNLQSQGIIKPIGIVHKQVRFDENYAAYQERGRRKDGSRVVRRYTTPGTGKDYLKGAGKQVAPKAINYLRQAASRVHV